VSYDRSDRIDRRKGLIRGLMNFQGGVFVVSHDEHLITAVCDELWIIRDKKVTLSEGQ
jgi:ATP-binding cassette subfamily F protein 3